MAGKNGANPIGASGSRFAGSTWKAPSTPKASRTASSSRFITVMTLIASDMPQRFTAVNTTVAATINATMPTSGQKYVRTASAKISAYIAQASVLPTQKNQPVRNARGRGSVRLVNE